ncbi:MAG TPA: CHAT domain-containing protein [Pyrinomonadaceae bacterium]|nr:CHAT domain-containing protein [Pyrinomonadaceae bacterium]
MNTVEPYQRRRFSLKWTIAVTVLSIAAVGLGVSSIFFDQSNIRKGLLSLNSAYRERRPFESRISSLDYAPFSITRGSGAVPVNNDELRHAELTLLDAQGKKATAETHHALGQVYLAQKRLEDAVREFEEALKTDPKNPLLLNDIGVAWLERGKIAPGADTETDNQDGKSMEALGHSLTYLNQALEGAEKPPLVHFNRALCFQYLRLPARAQSEWQAYLALDATSPWANEARHNLELLEERRSQSPHTKDQVLNDFLAAYDSRDEAKAWNLVSVTRDDLSGTSVSQQLLDSYLDASMKGQAGEASRHLQALIYVGELEVRKGGEHYTSDLAALCRSMSPERKASLVEARALMKTAYRMYEQSANVEDMLRVLEQAAKNFERAGDRVEVQHARFWIAYSSLSLDTERALDLLTNVAADCDRLRYRWLLMRTTQAIAGAKYNLREYSKAIEYSVQSLNLADEVGDQIGAFNSLDFLTEVYRAINNREQSMNSIGRSQPLLDCCAFNPIKVWRHYGIVALAFHSAGFPAIAIEYQREALQRALASGDPDMIAVSYVHLGLMLGKIGDYNEGLKNATLGYETAARRANEPSGKRQMAYASLQLGHLYRELGDCENALKNYDQSIALYEGQRFLTHIYQAHKGRLLCYIKQNNKSQAAAELQTTLSLIDNNRSTIFEDENRNNFFDIEQSVYDLGIEYAYETQKDPRTAFAYSEDSRARSLLNLMLNGRSKRGSGQEPNQVFDPLPVADIQRKLPEGNQIVEYTVLENKTLIWVVNKHHDLQVKESRVKRADLEARVASYLRLITDPNSAEEDLKKQGKELFDLLIGPVAALLDPLKQVNIIPDKVLSSLPFDSLVSSSSGNFLVQDYSLSYAPSSSVLVLASEKIGAMNSSRENERILAVGNPRFDQKRYNFLSDLKDAVGEARQIRASYDHGRVLVGPAATKQNILFEMPKSDVVHLALHSIEEPRAEMHSKLVLTKEQNGSSDVLEAGEIYELNLPRTRLIVLSACQTAVGRYYGGEGTYSFARAFLVSGVPVIVASLWPVDSEATARMMISFHQIRRQQHVSTAEALRRAQLKMIVETDPRLRHPYYWAAFSVFGGSEKSSVN